MKQQFCLKGFNVTRYMGEKKTADVYVTVDVDSIARTLGVRAAHNKSRQSRLQGGAIVVEVNNIFTEKK